MQACGGGGGVDDSGGSNTPDASLQIQAARDAPDGPSDLPIEGAIVTYVFGAVGLEPAGFFVQAAADGPALFIAVDPSGLSPSPVVGDAVSFVVDEMSTTDGMRWVTLVSALQRIATGVPIGPLVTNVNSAADLVSAPELYESRVVSLDGQMMTSWAFGGSGFQLCSIETAGLMGEPSLQLRLPTPLTVGSSAGCAFAIQVCPVWRRAVAIQVSPREAGDISITTCSGLMTVLSASATSASTIVVVFDREVAPGSVFPDGSQFLVTGGLAVSAASASGHEVVLTTSAQTGGVPYDVTAATSLQDVGGNALDATVNAASFLGYVP